MNENEEPEQETIVPAPPPEPPAETLPEHGPELDPRQINYMRRYSMERVLTVHDVDPLDRPAMIEGAMIDTAARAAASIDHAADDAPLDVVYISVNVFTGRWADHVDPPPNHELHLTAGSEKLK